MSTLNDTIAHLDVLIRHGEAYERAARQLLPTAADGIKRDVDAARLHLIRLRTEASVAKTTEEQVAPQGATGTEVKAEAELKVPDILGGLADLAEQVQPALRAIADLFQPRPPRT